MKKEIIYLIRHFYQIQEHRIAFGNQIKKLKEANLSTNPLDEYFVKLYSIEKEIAKSLKNSIKDEKIWKEFLEKVKGIGPILASTLINLIDIRKARHISSLWKLGLGTPVCPKCTNEVEKVFINKQGKKIKKKVVIMVDANQQGSCPKCRRKGIAPKPRRGVVLPYNPLLRTTFWKIGKSFLMTKSPYRKYYDQRKEYENLNNSQLKPFHIERRARRYMLERFLSDLWLKWREIEGLPISLPYACDKLGHKFQNYNPDIRKEIQN